MRPSPPADPDRTAADLLAQLAAEGTGKERLALLRFGIPNDCAFGVPMGRLLALAQDQPKDATLAQLLWQDGRYEARSLAVLLDDPDQLTAARMDAMVAVFDNWAICDTACFRLFDRTPLAWGRLPAWAAAAPLYTRRAAFALIWALALHDKAAPDEAFLAALALCEAQSADARPHVSKAVSMAIRATGRRNPILRAAALELADRLAGGDKSQQRIAREVRRYLTAGS